MWAFKYSVGQTLINFIKGCSCSFSLCCPQPQVRTPQTRTNTNRPHFPTISFRIIFNISPFLGSPFVFAPFNQSGSTTHALFPVMNLCLCRQRVVSMETGLLSEERGVAVRDVGTRGPVRTCCCSNAPLYELRTGSAVR